MGVFWLPRMGQPIDRRNKFKAIPSQLGRANIWLHKEGESWFDTAKGDNFCKVWLLNALKNVGFQLDSYIYLKKYDPITNVVVTVNQRQII